MGMAVSFESVNRMWVLAPGFCPRIVEGELRYNMAAGQEVHDTRSETIHFSAWSLLCTEAKVPPAFRPFKAPVRNGFRVLRTQVADTLVGIIHKKPKEGRRACSERVPRCRDTCNTCMDV